MQEARADLEAAMSWLTTDENPRVDALITAARAEGAAEERARLEVTEAMIDRAFEAFTGWPPATENMTPPQRHALRSDLRDALTAALEAR